MSNNNQPGSSQIGFYQLDRVIGKGNFAIVRLATHTITDTKVAIKIIDKDKMRLDAENRRKVAREVEIMKLLEHPHVIRLYQVMETERYLYLVTEYASKGEIFEYLLSNGKMAEEDARKKFCQIVLAVDYCHLKGIVHRDLKAENLLLDEALNVKLADFGFSNHYCQNEMLKTWCGSPPYAAPELFEGKEYCGPPADIWSLGVVLYVMVCGALPFDGSNLQHLRARVLAGRFRIPYYMSEDCERLIRRMLQLDPSKRIPLTSVLKHRWMEGVEVTMDMPTQCHRVSNASGESVLWNDQVLMAIQNMNYNVDACKQAVQNRLYNDHAALYYLLLSKCEKGKLSIPLTKLRATHPRLSLSGVPPMIPQISIQKTESKPSNGPSLATLDRVLNCGGVGSGRGDEKDMEETEQLIRDINLDRYLNHGRRHTLGAAHNSVMAEDIKRLELNENSNNQLSNGFGSCNGEDNPTDPGGTGGGVGGTVMAWHAMPGSGTMGSSGIQPNFDHSSLSSVGGPMRPSHQQQYKPQPHQFLPLPKNPRMGRRVSDGGPYVAAYRLFIDKRNPLPQIKSSNNIERCDSTSMNSTNSVKLLLQETQEKKCYGGLPNSRREWLEFKNQVHQQKQLSRATTPLTTMTWNQLLSKQSLQDQPTLMPDLRTQVQPFQDLQPDEIQDQLQKLHIQLPPDALVVIPTQQQHQGQDYDPGLSSVLVDNGYANPYTASESNSSGSSSRKSSTSNSLIAQLLGQSPPALPISSPQTEGSSSAGCTYTPATPSSSLPPSQLNSVPTMRRSSLQDATAIPSKHCRPQRKTLGDLFTTTSKQLPSFPISIQPNSPSRSYRESSPTKGGGGLYSSSPTNSLTLVGRRSPNHEVQMDAIAEDCTEDSTTPTNIHPPAVIPSEVIDLISRPLSPRCSNGSGGGDWGRGVPRTVGSNGSFQSHPLQSTKIVDKNRQRKTGVHMVKCPVSPHMVSAMEAKMCDCGGHLGVGEDDHLDNNGLHHLLSQPSPIIHPSVKQVSTNTLPILATSHPQVLMGMLQAPVYNTLTSVAAAPPPSPPPPQTLISSKYIYSTNNYQMQTSVPTPTPSTMSCGQSTLDASTLLQMQISSNHKVLSHILKHSGIPFLHQNNVFSVNHLGVQFQIHVTNEIQLQFIAGDTMQYQSLCSELFSRLAPSVQ